MHNGDGRVTKGSTVANLRVVGDVHRRVPVAAKVSVPVVVLLVAAVLVLGAIPGKVLPMFLGQRYDPEQYDPAEHGYYAREIPLVTDDGLELAAWRMRSLETKGTVVILSGLRSPSVTAFFGYAKMLADEGWDSLLVEMRARGQSEGDGIGFGMTEWRDVKAGVDFLTQDDRVRDMPIVAMGTSMGGATSIIAAGAIPRIDAVISMSSFSSWEDLFKDHGESLGVPPLLTVLDQPFMRREMGFVLGDDALGHSPIRAIGDMGDRPILLMHSTGDGYVPFSQFEKLVGQAESAGVDVTTFVREGDFHAVCMEHLVPNPREDAEFAGAVLGFLDTKFP